MTLQRLPKAVTDLLIALDDLPKPEAVVAVQHIVVRALEAPNPAGMLNLSLRRLKQRASTLQFVRRWLDEPAVVAAAQRAGAHWTLARWRDALDAIAAGSKPHEAFGMARAGRRSSPAFSPCDDLAAYVQHRVRGGAAVAAVLADVRPIVGNRMPDDRVLRAARAKLANLADADLKALADVARRKLKLP